MAAPWRCVDSRLTSRLAQRLLLFPTYKHTINSAPAYGHEFFVSCVGHGARSSMRPCQKFNSFVKMNGVQCAGSTEQINVPLTAFVVRRLSCRRHKSQQNKQKMKRKPKHLHAQKVRPFRQHIFRRQMKEKKKKRLEF